MISREEALSAVKELNEEADMTHYLESEAVCGAVAEKLGEDVAYYKMLGLVHDIDWGQTKDDPTTHLTKAPEILKELGFDQEFIDTVLSHGYGFDCADLQDKKRTEKIQFALAASESVTGLIHAYALMRGGITGMKVKGLKKKFKDKAFARTVDREVILEAENLMSMEEFYEIAIKAIEGIKEDVGLE